MFDGNPTRLAHLKTALKKLLNTLDSIPEGQEELKYDVESTLRLYEVIFHAFIMLIPGYALPVTGFWTDCDAEVRETLFDFVVDAGLAADREGLNSPEQRFKAFQDGSVLSDSGNDYSRYFGHAPSFQRLCEVLGGADTK